MTWTSTSTSFWKPLADHSYRTTKLPDFFFLFRLFGLLHRGFTRSATLTAVFYSFRSALIPEPQIIFMLFSSATASVQTESRLGCRTVFYFVRKRKNLEMRGGFPLISLISRKWWFVNTPNVMKLWTLLGKGGGLSQSPIFWGRKTAKTQNMVVSE